MTIEEIRATLRPGNAAPEFEDISAPNSPEIQYLHMKPRNQHSRRYSNEFFWIRQQPLLSLQNKIELVAKVVAESPDLHGKNEVIPPLPQSPYVSAPMNQNMEEDEFNWKYNMTT